MNMKRLLAAALSAALLLALTACGSTDADGGQTDGSGPSGVAVQVEEVLDGTIFAENTVSGKIEPEDQATIMVAVNAKCTKVYAEAGDIVQAGQALCTLDLGSTLSSYNAANISYQSSVQGYQDQSAVFEMQIALLEKTVQDLRELFAIGAASQMEIDQAELQLQTAVATRNSTLSQLEAGMQSAKSNVEQLATVLENVDSQGNVIAPSSGTLVTMNAVENGFVSSAAPVAIIDGVEQMKVTVSVSEALVPKLAAGGKADVTVSAIEQSFEATIRAVEKAANMQTKLYNVTLAVPSDVSGLLAGMFADVTFHTDVSENTVVAPTEAVISSGGSQYVFIVENNTAKQIQVSTGLTGNGVTEITSGLEPGMQLVTVGQAYLTDGTAVRIVSGLEETDADTEAASPEDSGGAAPQDGGGEAA
ncbi:MAG: efflux RND transporter periplasmic adaptor subunit [Oscillibacter sp.]|jgi:RND family efflux transporter MFP subunit|nr:efflux RND transporter periplasmic adaptor subunit [Oscillibacter sp.]